MRTAPGYESVVFASGGCRCLWQGGFWQTVAPALVLAPRTVAAVSAGAAMACVLFAGVMVASLQSFKRRAARNERNVYPRKLFSRERVFPHERIYRETILENLDIGALQRLHAGPDVRVVLSRVPEWLGPRSAVVAGFVAYRAEQMIRRPVHTNLARRLGFAPEIVSIRDCSTPEEVAELILQSSCTPPFTPVYQRGSRPVLDGGLVDSVPVDAVDALAHPTLVLLTKRYPPDVIPRVDGRTYVQPSQPVPIATWDYTSPHGVQATFDLGCRDADRFIKDLAERN